MGFWLHTESGAIFPEVDIEESLGNRRGQALHEAHVGKNAKTGTGVWSFKLSPGYHTFGLDWEKQSLVWYVDGKCLPAVHPTATQKCFTVIHNVPAQPMYLIANFAIDGNKTTHNGPTKATPSVGSFNVRYVEVWQHG
jgi:beta-glucanase (GH16 family)